MSENKTNKIRLSQIASEIVVPRNITLKSGNYYAWGNNNYYPYQVLEAMYNSPTHQRLIESKVKAIIGQGIQVENQENLDEYMRFGNRDLNTVIKGLAFDYCLFGSFAIKVANSMNGEYKHINNLDFTGLRYETELDENDNPVGIIFSRDWRNLYLKENRRKQYPMYSKYDDSECSVFIYHEDTKGGERYPRLPYESAMESILCEHEIQLFWYRNISNNFSPTLVLTMASNMPDEDFQLMKDQLDRKYKGSNAAGGVMIIAGESEETTPKITPITPILQDSVYLETMNSIRENIMVAHGVTNPSVAGLPSQNAFSSGDEIHISYELFNRTTISYMRKTIENALNTIFDNSKWNLGKITIVPTDYNIEKVNNQTDTQEVNTDGNTN